MQGNELEKHIRATYVNLRLGMALLAVIFAPLLYFVGHLQGISLQNSMSAYFWAVPDCAPCGATPPGRTWFVGLLFAIGFFMMLYKGFTRAESLLLNFAGAFGVGVALFPMAWPACVCGETCKKVAEQAARAAPAAEHANLLEKLASNVSAHGAFAGALFLCIACISLFCSGNTLHLVKDPTMRTVYKAQYRFCAAVMLASPLSAWVLLAIFGTQKEYTYFLELAGIVAFAYYWAVKSVEIAKTGADELAAKGNLVSGKDSPTD